MADDQTLGLIAKVAGLAAIGAFYPQIMKAWRKLGYRRADENDGRSLKGLIGAFAVIIGFLLIAGLIDSIYKVFK